MVKFRKLDRSESGSQKSDKTADRRRLPKESASSFSRLGSAMGKRVTPDPVVGSGLSSEGIKSLYEDTSDYLNQVFTAVKQKASFDLAAGVDIIRRMVEIPPHEDSLFIKAIHFDDKLAFLANKCINVAIYAIRIGQQLAFGKEQLEELGLAGLMHEVGMCAIPEKILYKKGKLSEEEFHFIKQHSDLGYQILSAYGDRYAFLADVVVQVHERSDGSGYPLGLAGEEIHPYAQIIGLVDTYEAISHSRPQREKFSHFQTIKEIIKTGKKKFNRSHLKALVSSFSIFPLSSYVRLNSNAIGRVIQTYPDSPLRPIIQIVWDSQGRAVVAKRIINLKENSLLYITDAVSEDDLTNLASHRTAVTGSAGMPPSEPAVTLPDDEPEEIRPPKEKRRTVSDRKKPSKPFILGLILSAAVVVALLIFQPGVPSHPVARSDASPQPAGQKISIDSNARVSAEAARKPMAQADAEVPESPASVEEKEVNPPQLAESAAVAHPAPIRPAGESNVLPAPRPMPVAETDGTTDGSSKEGGDSVEIAARIETERPSYPYSILFGSFKQLDRAEKAAELIEEKGLTAYWARVDLGNRGTWYRVFAGYFNNRKQAREAAEAHQLEGMLVKKTAYSTLVGTFFSDQALKQTTTRLKSLGFSPYAITGPAGESYLYVGAFITEKGAKDQFAQLAAKGINPMIAKR